MTWRGALAATAARSSRRAMALAGLAALASSGCSRVEHPAHAGRHPWTIPGVVRIGSSDEPDNLNPMFAHSDATDQIDAFIFAPLFRYDENGEFVPELATEVPTYRNRGISADSKTIVLHVRRNVMWSDGAPLTARDVRFTWRAVRNPRNDVKATFGWDDVASIDVPNPYTAVVHLVRPNADVLGLFADGGSAYPPLPEHLLGTLPDLNRAAFNEHPISSGPWLLRAWHHGSSLEFAPNARYWRGPPKLRAITWKVVPNPDTLLAQLATHEIDVYPSAAEEIVPRLAALPGITVQKRLIASWRRLAMNCARPALRDARVRLAIAETVDWDRLNATVYHGLDVRATSDIPPDSWAAPRIPFYRHDPAGAMRLLDAAGWRPGPDGIRSRAGEQLHLQIFATNKPGNEQAEEFVQQALRAAGIELTIKNYPANVLFAQNGPLYSGAYDLEWSIDTNGPDPDNQGNWSGDFVPPRGANTSFLRDAEITRLSDAALRTFDRARRKALYQREEERIHALVPVVFFYWHTGYAAFDDDVRGYRVAEYITDNWNSWAWSN